MYIVFHIRGGQLGPFWPPENVNLGPQNRPKMVFFGLKWPYVCARGKLEVKTPQIGSVPQLIKTSLPTLIALPAANGLNLPFPPMKHSVFEDPSTTLIVPQNESFWGVPGPPNDISVWSKRPKLTPPDVENNVQPCSPNVQPIRGRWDYLCPNMAILGQKRSILGGSRAPQ